MVVGIGAFRRYFEAHNGKYVLIGGAACDVLFASAGLPFRATKDLDIVLCVEVVDAEFARAFADFLDAAGYRKRAVYDGAPKYYRFADPTDNTFPAIIELFARAPADVALPDSSRYVRLGVEDAIVSLSALLLDTDYYAAIEQGRDIIDGVSILRPTVLIPFKARAYLDLSERKAAGERIDSKDVAKHRNDVFRLIQPLPAEGAAPLAEPLKGDLRRFVAVMAGENMNPKLSGRVVEGGGDRDSDTSLRTVM